MATYPEWNQALCAFLFNAENAGKTVYLHVPEEAFADDEKLRALGGYQAFKADMLRELGGVPAELLILADRKWQEDLRHLRSDAATIIPGHLALMMILAAATEIDRDDIEPNAYYALIACFFGMNHVGFVLKGVELIPQLYRRISTWSLGSCEGKKGVFKPQQLGARPNVGLIHGQTIFRKSDVEELWQKFHHAGWRPGDDYSSDDFSTMLETGSFSLRVKMALANENLRQVAVLRAQEELETWDGHLTNEGQAKLGTDGSSLGRILLQIYQEKPLVPRRTVGIRLRDPREYFDSYTIVIPCGNGVTPLKRVVSPDPHNPGLTNIIIKPSEAQAEGMMPLSSAFDIYSEDRSFIFSYRPRKVRYFIEAGLSGHGRMNGWIETTVMTSGKKHIIMIDCRFYEEFIACNDDSLKGVSDISNTMEAVLSQRFRFISVERILRTLVDSRNNVVGTFSVYDRPRIRLIAGLKSTGRGNAYMRNSPPRILKFTGLDSECEILGVEEFYEQIGEVRNSESSILDYQPKPGIIMPNVLNISVVKNNLTLARCELVFEDYGVHPVVDPLVNAIGSIFCSPQKVDTYHPRTVVANLPQAPLVKILGRRPGELCDIQSFSDVIEPCWVVELRGNESTFHYIGKQALVSSQDYLYKFTKDLSPNFMGVAKKNAWVRFHFAGNVRCGTCAHPMPYGRSIPVVSPIGQFFKQQRDFINLTFPGLK